MLHSLGGSQGRTKTLNKWRETSWVVNLEGDEIIQKGREGFNSNYLIKNETWQIKAKFKRARWKIERSNK